LKLLETANLTTLDLKKQQNSS